MSFCNHCRFCVTGWLVPWTTSLYREGLGVWSAREKSLEILRRGWEFNPGHGEDRQWAIPLSYHDWLNSYINYINSLVTNIGNEIGLFGSSQHKTPICIACIYSSASTQQRTILEWCLLCNRNSKLLRLHWDLFPQQWHHICLFIISECQFVLPVWSER